MHEFDICERLFDQIAAAQARQHFSAVKRVRMEVGLLSTADPEALHQAFEIMVRDTFLAGADLEITRVPSQGDCLACGATVVVATPPAVCPACGSKRLRAAPGNGTRFVDMDVA